MVAFPFLRHIAFASDRQLEVFSQSEQWHCDGTFKSAPELVSRTNVPLRYNFNARSNKKNIQKSVSTAQAIYSVTIQTCKNYERLWAAIQKRLHWSIYECSSSMMPFSFYTSKLASYSRTWPSSYKKTLQHLTKKIQRSELGKGNWSAWTCAIKLSLNCF